MPGKERLHIDLRGIRVAHIRIRHVSVASIPEVHWCAPNVSSKPVIEPPRGRSKLLSAAKQAGTESKGAQERPIYQNQHKKRTTFPARPPARLFEKSGPKVPDGFRTGLSAYALYP
ncbi:hypothetical protein GCM10017612_40970 [Novosphingobium resinovorum]|nr:hypothetical protein GCM10017612_40970 [Novosphingobium resinovorum]